MINEISTEPPVLNRKAEFELLAKENMKRSYYVALGFLGSHDSAMEVSQQAFIKAYRHFDKFDSEKKFFTWFYKILRNLCLNALRDKKRKKEVSFLEAARNDKFLVDPEEAIERDELLNKLEESLMELSAEEREIILLKEFENMTYKEISEILEIPSGSVMSRLFYARKKLAGKLKRKL